MSGLGLDEEFFIQEDDSLLVPTVIYILLALTFTFLLTALEARLGQKKKSRYEEFFVQEDGSFLLLKFYLHLFLYLVQP